MNHENTNKIYLIIILFLFHIQSSKPRDYECVEQGNSQKKAFLGTIKLPEDFTSDSEIYLCYKGEIIKVHPHDKYFMIKDQDNLKMNVIFTSPENITFCAEENTIFCLRLTTNSKYKFYNFTKTELNQQNNKWTWDIKESKLLKKNKNNDLKVPLNTLIIPLDPKEIDLSLENVSWKKDSKLAKLPVIVIKTHDKEKTEDQFLKASLAWLNLKPFHAQKKQSTIHHDNHKILLFNDNE